MGLVVFIRDVSPIAAAATVGFFLFNLVGLKVLGCAGGSKSNRSNAKASLEFGVVIGGFAAITPALLVGAMSPLESLCAEGAEGGTGNDFAATILGKVAILITFTVEEGSDTGTSKGALGEMKLVVVVGALAAAASAAAAATGAGPATATIGDVVVFVLAVVLFTAAAIVPRHGPVAVASVGVAAIGVPVVWVSAIGTNGAGTDLTAFMSVVVVVLVGATSDYFAVDVSFSDDHGAGLWTVVKDRLGGRGLLDNNLLGLRGLLANDDGGRGGFGMGVVLCLLAIALDIMAAVVFKGLFDAALDTNIVGSGAAVPVTLTLDLSCLHDGGTGALAVGWVKVGTGTVDVVVGYAAARAGEVRASVVLDFYAIIAVAVFGANLVAGDGGGFVAVVIVVLAVGSGRPICVAHAAALSCMCVCVCMYVRFAWRG